MHYYLDKDFTLWYIFPSRYENQLDCKPLSFSPSILKRLIFQKFKKKKEKKEAKLVNYRKIKLHILIRIKTNNNLPYMICFENVIKMF